MQDFSRNDTSFSQSTSRKMATSKYVHFTVKTMEIIDLKNTIIVLIYEIYVKTDRVTDNFSMLF
jgi:hypothetical protein